MRTAREKPSAGTFAKYSDWMKPYMTNGLHKGGTCASWPLSDLKIKIPIL